MFWKNRSVFVTGGSGFLGSWLINELVHQKASVVALIRDSIPLSKFYQENTFKKVISVQGTIEDYNLIDRVLNEFEIDTVFHLAAQSVVTIANSNPRPTLQSNVMGTWNILEASRLNKVKKVVVASSDKAYGDSKVLPYTEDMPVYGLNPYDASKSCSDLISQMYAHHYNLPVCITRCSNLFGGGDLNLTRVVPKTILSVLDGRRPVINGTHFQRDFLYIKDAVYSYLLLAEHMDRPEIQGQVFNFGLGDPVQIEYLILRIIGLMRSDIEPVYAENVHGEISVQFLNTIKAQSLLGWKPQFSLEEGLNETIEWYRQNYAESSKRE